MGMMLCCSMPASLKVEPNFWLNPNFWVFAWWEPKNHKICEKWAYFPRKILNNGYPFLPKWPLKMGRGFEAQAAHPCPNQIWVPPKNNYWKSKLRYSDNLIRVTYKWVVMSILLISGRWHHLMEKMIEYPQKSMSNWILLELIRSQIMNSSINKVELLHDFSKITI